MRDILNPMARRLFALVLALAVVSAPVALEVCQITCESKGAPHAMSHAAEGHAAHHYMPAGHAACHKHGEAPQQLSPLDGACDHGGEATPSLVAARNFDPATSLLAALPTFESISIVPIRDVVSAHGSAWSNRLAIPLAVPLRV
jgi:hypothetical protein